MNQIRAKITVIGDGRVGKTSIVKALLNEDFNARENSTEGIDINSIHLEDGLHQITASIWDFGGQEIYHSTYRLFMNKKSLYVLVIESRSESNIQYWLNSVQTLAGNIPILIVLNKIDERYIEIDISHIKKEYPNVIDLLKTSCKTKAGISELKEALKKNLIEFNFFTLPSIKWQQVEEFIIQNRKDYFSYQNFIEICLKYGILDRKEQNSLSAYLSELGILIRFKGMSLHNFNVAKPEWITSIIYTIIDSKLASDRKGIISFKEIEEVLIKRFDLSKNQLLFVVNLLNEFEFLIQLENNYYIIPNLLSFQEPNIEFDFNKALQFVVKYNFLPSDLFPRIIHRLKKYVEKEEIWNNGLIIRLNSGIGILKKNFSSEKILVYVQGENRRDLLYLLRETISNVSKTYKIIKFEEYIPIESKGEIVNIKYSYLLALQERNQQTALLPETLEEVKVDSVLFDIGVERKIELSPLQVFISYAEEDFDFKVQLTKHISTLIKLNKIILWDKDMISPGEVWKIETQDKLINSDIILCLISSDFIHSEFSDSKELEDLIDHHNRNLKKIIPVLVRPCFWEELPIAQVKWVPKKAISRSKNTDKEWKNVVKYINKVTLEITGRKYNTKRSVKRL